MARPIYEMLTKGQTVRINGKLGSYQVTKVLKETVFQASTVGTNTPVLVKTESPVPGIYRMEVNCYEFRCIQHSPYIRSIREVIDNGTDKCMVFEWMDSDLWSLRSRAQKLGRPFLKVAAKSVLEAVKVFSDMDGQDPVVHTDINPNNVLVSNVDLPKPIVKLADLGAGRAHPFIASTLPRSSSLVWAIGKIIHLVGPLERNEDLKYKLEFDLAGVFVKRRIIKIGTLEEELAKVNAPADCIDFIQYLLTLDHKKRPTAEEALQHPWLQNSE